MYNALLKSLSNAVLNSGSKQPAVSRRNFLIGAGATGLEVMVGGITDSSLVSEANAASKKREECDRHKPVLYFSVTGADPSEVDNYQQGKPAFGSIVLDRAAVRYFGLERGQLKRVSLQQLAAYRNAYGQRGLGEDCKGRTSYDRNPKQHDPANQMKEIDNMISGAWTAKCIYVKFQSENYHLGTCGKH